MHSIVISTTMLEGIDYTIIGNAINIPTKQGVVSAACTIRENKLVLQINNDKISEQIEAWCTKFGIKYRKEQQSGTENTIRKLPFQIGCRR